ncbi:hypothetical protein E4U43_001274, partial [Claviceps pusilla]
MKTEKKLLYIKIAAPKTPKRRSRADRRSSDSETYEVIDSCLDFGPPSYAHATTTQHSDQHSDLRLLTPDTVSSCIDWDSPESSSIIVDDSQYLGDIPACEADNTACVFVSQTKHVCRTYADSFLTTVIGPEGSPLQILEFCSPSFGEFSQDSDERFLMSYFCNTLSHLIVLREDQGNPFQQLVLPLARNSQAVKGAIYALASAHLVGKGRNSLENDDKSIQFHTEAIRNLAKLIAKGGTVDRNELLATIVLIVYYEV